jgi:hypothetical protein
MKTFSLLTVGLLSTAVAADPNGHHKPGKHDHECMRLLKWEHLLQMSSNKVLMARLQKNHHKRADKINSLKNNAQSNITAIQGSHPADWLANCHVKGAHMQLKKQCGEKVFLPKIQTKWNNQTKTAEIMKHHNWNDTQFAEEKKALDDKVNDLKNNKTLSELCVKLPKGNKGDKGDKGDGKDGKADGKGDKGGKTPDKGAGK